MRDFAFDAMKILAPLLLGLAAAAGTLPSAADTLDDIRARGAVRLGYSETKAPFSFKAKDDGQPAGFAVELCQRVAVAVAQALKGTSLKVEWVALDPATRIEAVAQGRVDIECSTTTPTLARRETVDFSIPFYADSATLLGRSDKAIAIPELRGRRIAVADNTTTVAALERGLRARQVGAQIVKTRTLAQAFAMLKAGEVEAIAGDRTALAGTFLIGGGGEGFSVFAEDLSYEPYSLVVRKGDTRMRLLVDGVLARLYRSEDIDALYARWLLPLGKPSPALVTLYMLHALPE
jgi:ABC-type amino acid transport substrate-binding protein